MQIMFKRLTLISVCLSLGACALSREETAEPPAELVEFSSEFRMEKVWSKGLGGDSSSLRLGLQPASDNARVYAGSRNGDVLALDQASGNVVWRVKSKLPLAAGPGLGQDVLALGSSDGDLIVIDKDSGEIRWQKQLSSEIVATPLVARGLVIVRTVDGFLRGLSADDGKESWQVQFEVPRLSLRGNAAPIMYGTVVIAGFDNGKVAAVSAANGAIAWQATLAQPRGRTELERLVDVDARPVQVGEDLYLAGYQGRVVLVRPASGQLIWSQDMSSFSGMAADWNRLFVTDENSEVVALERKTGIEVWRNKQLRARALTAPAVFGESVVVGDFEGYLHFLSRETGEFQARIRVGKDAIVTPPLILDAGLAVQTSGGQVTVLRRK
ncbi:MAG: outer membrane protein assembly factor BamB [Gammaproteobacteria bacterium]|nr:outer membrane protein assembly factor BamB [Gammaproteobacteria bacterium]